MVTFRKRLAKALKRQKVEIRTKSSEHEENDKDEEDEEDDDDEEEEDDDDDESHSKSDDESDDSDYEPDLDNERDGSQKRRKRQANMVVRNSEVFFKTLVSQLLLLVYLRRRIGGVSRYSNDESTQICKKASCFLAWMYNNFYNQCQISVQTIKDIVKTTLRCTGHHYISSYFEYLEAQQYSPVTLCHSARHIMLTFKWAFNKLSGISRIPWAPFQAFMKDLSATYKRHNTKVKSVNGDNDMDVLQVRNEWPSGGLIQLRRCVEEHAPESIRWAESLPSDPSDFTYFTTRLCSSFTAVMLAALYIFHIQGRPQALQKLTFHQFMKFWTKKSNPLSRFLKTSKSCKFQVISIANELCSHLIHLYITKVRPALVAWRAAANRPYRGCEPWLLPTQSQTRYKVCQAVQGFFRKHCDGLTLNLNRIRAICSSEMKKAFESDIVSRAHRQSSSRTTGHGKRAREQYYNKAERLYDAAVANDAMQRIYDPDAHDIARIKCLRKQISRAQKELAFLLLRQRKKHMRTLDDKEQIDEGVVENPGDNHSEEEEMELGQAGGHDEGFSDYEEEEEADELQFESRVFENPGDNHSEEEEMELGQAGGRDQGFFNYEEEAEADEMQFESHKDDSINRLDEDAVQVDEGGIDVHGKEVQLERPGPGSKRNKWTAAEISYVEEWIKAYRYRPVGELYRHILGDAHAVKEIFHWRHIASVGRLDYMFKKCHKGL